MLTKKDTECAEQIGYIIDIQPELAAELLNKHYPGIDLVNLLMQVDELLGNYAEKPVYKRLVIGDTPEPHFEIIYRSANHSNPKNGLELIRSLYFKQEVLNC